MNHKLMALTVSPQTKFTNDCWFRMITLLWRDPSVKKNLLELLDVLISGAEGKEKGRILTPSYLETKELIIIRNYLQEPEKDENRVALRAIFIKLEAQKSKKKEEEIKEVLHDTLEMLGLLWEHLKNFQEEREIELETLATRSLRYTASDGSTIETVEERIPKGFPVRLQIHPSQTIEKTSGIIEYCTRIQRENFQIEREGEEKKKIISSNILLTLSTQKTPCILEIEEVGSVGNTRGHYIILSDKEPYKEGPFTLMQVIEYEREFAHYRTYKCVKDENSEEVYWILYDGFSEQSSKQCIPYEEIEEIINFGLNRLRFIFSTEATFETVEIIEDQETKKRNKAKLEMLSEIIVLLQKELEETQKKISLMRAITMYLLEDLEVLESFGIESYENLWVEDSRNDIFEDIKENIAIFLRKLQSGRKPYKNIRLEESQKKYIRELADTIEDMDSSEVKGCLFDGVDNKTINGAVSLTSDENEVYQNMVVNPDKEFTLEDLKQARREAVKGIYVGEEEAGEEDIRVARLWKEHQEIIKRNTLKNTYEKHDEYHEKDLLLALANGDYRKIKNYNLRLPIKILAKRVIQNYNISLASIVYIKNSVRAYEENKHKQFGEKSLSVTFEQTKHWISKERVLTKKDLLIKAPILLYSPNKGVEADIALQWILLFKSEKELDDHDNLLLNMLVTKKEDANKAIAIFCKIKLYQAFLSGNPEKKAFEELIENNNKLQNRYLKRTEHETKKAEIEAILDELKLTPHILTEESLAFLRFIEETKVVEEWKDKEKETFLTQLESVKIETRNPVETIETRLIRFLLIIMTQEEGLNSVWIRAFLDYAVQDLELLNRINKVIPTTGELSDNFIYSIHLALFLDCIEDLGNTSLKPEHKKFINTLEALGTTWEVEKQKIRRILSESLITEAFTFKKIVSDYFELSTEEKIKKAKSDMGELEKEKMRLTALCIGKMKFNMENVKKLAEMGYPLMFSRKMLELIQLNFTQTVLTKELYETQKTNAKEMGISIEELLTMQGIEERELILIIHKIEVLEKLKLTTETIGKRLTEIFTDPAELLYALFILLKNKHNFQNHLPLELSEIEFFINIQKEILGSTKDKLVEKLKEIKEVLEKKVGRTLSKEEFRHCILENHFMLQMDHIKQKKLMECLERC